MRLWVSNAAKATGGDPKLLCACMPNLFGKLEVPQKHTQGIGLSLETSDSIGQWDIAYLHHTSGTSTGVPKPIPQTHRAAVAVLPVFDTGHKSASFTTTPLYHGGVADCFRAWTSGALIWLFPGKHVPITASNVLRCLDAAKTCAEISQVSPVKYFSSVPYVLQMLASENEGLEALRQMDIVGVGGAALTQEIGDDLVTKGINLVSRFGSAECGFLLSSHRDYGRDKEWSYLRSHGSPLLNFSHERGDGLRELVVRHQWPHMAKRNTEDGDYATSDLFQAHPSLPYAWKYHSRADSQLALATGKKFDPAPLEDVMAASPLLDDVLLFGNGQQYPGALLFRSSKSENFSEGRLIEDVWPAVEKLNGEKQDHARIARSMLVVMPKESPTLPKSSKGTIIRREAETAFADIIRHVYEGPMPLEDGQDDNTMANVPPDHQVAIRVRATVEQVMAKSEPIPADADLFSYGVGSVACMQIRGRQRHQVLGWCHQPSDQEHRERHQQCHQPCRPELQLDRRRRGGGGAVHGTATGGDAGGRGLGRSLGGWRGHHVSLNM